MMTRFSTLRACETICAGLCLGEYSLGECFQSELSLKKRVSIQLVLPKRKIVNIATDTTILKLNLVQKGPKKTAILAFILMAVGGQYQSKEANTYRKIHNRRPLVSLSHFEICKSNLISLCLYQYDSLLNQLKLFWFKMTRNKHHLTVIPILGKVIRSYIILNYEKNFTF